MLGRTANGLYWMFRYIERAENIARLIDAGLGFPSELRNDTAARSAVADAAERMSRGDWSGLPL